jgi:hypothetical protein
MAHRILDIRVQVNMFITVFREQIIAVEGRIKVSVLVRVSTNI